MNDKYFIDTNILIYSIDNQDKVKKPRSLALVNEAIISRNGIISWQVLQEFLKLAQYNCMRFYLLQPSSDILFPLR